MIDQELPHFRGGQIVLVDWRGGALPRDPNKIRPAVGVQDDALLVPGYQNVIVVPLTEDGRLVVQSLSLSILPTAQNGCSKPCWAASHLVATASKRRVKATPSSVTADQLASMRGLLALAIRA